MNALELKIERRETCRICFFADIFGNVLPALFSDRRGMIFSDGNVLRLYGDALKKSVPNVYVHTMSEGEAHKTPETLLELLRSMAERELGRGDLLVALGGGVVGDLGGLAASLYMRGIDFVQIPTTLLAQVDASVGGKAAVDLCGVKNLIGTIRQPKTVYLDPSFLSTLPRAEIKSGLGEIVKHAALDGALFDEVLSNRGSLFDLAFLARIVPQNVRFKAEIVGRDPFDLGLRRGLNLGHTTAHAIELSCGLSHGESVLCGIVYEAELAKRHFACDGKYLADLESLCTQILGFSPKEIDLSAALRLARFDKKNPASGSVVCIVPQRRGTYASLELPFEQYQAELAAIESAL